MKTTLKPHEAHGQHTAQSDLPNRVHAFPKQRKEPLTDARHVGNAVARFDQVIKVSDADRALAFAISRGDATVIDLLRRTSGIPRARASSTRAPGQRRNRR